MKEAEKLSQSGGSDRWKLFTASKAVCAVCKKERE